MEDYLELLKKYKFDKQLKKLNKSLKGKKVVIYGAGAFFETIIKNYNLQEMNIIGISDLKYNLSQEGQTDFGYKIIPRDKIIQYNPDVILISTLNTFQIYRMFKQQVFKGTKIRICPLVDKPFVDLFMEVFR